MFWYFLSFLLHRCNPFASNTKIRVQDFWHHTFCEHMTYKVVIKKTSPICGPLETVPFNTTGWNWEFIYFKIWVQEGREVQQTKPHSYGSNGKNHFFSSQYDLHSEKSQITLKLYTYTGVGSSAKLQYSLLFTLVNRVARNMLNNA